MSQGTHQNYYTMLIRFPDQPWEIHFGDFHRPTVKEEQETYCYDMRHPKSMTRIITTDPTQSSIQAEVSRLNHELGYYTDVDTAQIHGK